MLAADAAEFGIVEQQVGQFPALLDQVDVGQAANALFESVYADQFAKDQSGVVKTEGLVEVTDE